MRLGVPPPPLSFLCLLLLLLQLYGRIDILVSNAAVNPTAGPLLETPAEAIDKILDVNIKAAVLLVQVGMRHVRGHRVLCFMC